MYEACTPSLLFLAFYETARHPIHYLEIRVEFDRVGYDIRVECDIRVEYDIRLIFKSCPENLILTFIQLANAYT